MKEVIIEAGLARASRAKDSTKVLIPAAVDKRLTFLKVSIEASPSFYIQCRLCLCFVALELIDFTELYAGCAREFERDAEY